MAGRSDGLEKLRFDRLEQIAHEEGARVTGRGRGGYPRREDLIRDIRAHRKAVRESGPEAS